MNNRSWIHSVSPEELKRRNKLMAEHFEQGLHQMEQWTEEECRRLKMTTRAREAAERAWRRVVVWGRKYLLLPRHTPVERRFLRMMIKLTLAEVPGLVDRAVEVARYLSSNYAFEWLLSPCTRAARAEARALLLTSAESQFGETPLARQVAFVQYHWRQLHIRNVADLGEVYSMALFLEQHHFFMSTQDEWRKSLGLHRLALQRQRQAPKEQVEAEEKQRS
ncbi:MAG: hypothetical protein H5T86_11630 [Armatimonadetes bacterium]|nr:hypothetical protein [Armatimonadota bacterium]